MKEVEVRFRENFSTGRDSGSGMCVFEGEKKLISLYGGYLGFRYLALAGGSDQKIDFISKKVSFIDTKLCQ
ncbi:hypothetical protein EBU02_14870 [bacterium]|jgi:hypothetical protein|nr:hypothetical protein [bacterium]